MKVQRPSASLPPQASCGMNCDAILTTASMKVEGRTRVDGMPAPARCSSIARCASRIALLVLLSTPLQESLTKCSIPDEAAASISAFSSCTWVMEPPRPRNTRSPFSNPSASFCGSLKSIWKNSRPSCGPSFLAARWASRVRMRTCWPWASSSRVTLEPNVPVPPAVTNVIAFLLSSGTSCAGIAGGFVPAAVGSHLVVARSDREHYAEPCVAPGHVLVCGGGIAERAGFGHGPDVLADGEPEVVLVLDRAAGERAANSHVIEHQLHRGPPDRRLSKAEDNKPSAAGQSVQQR